jgi:pyruvate/2-oxoglutarate dehydrogenase complex dihydrolipoamide dehydrogenase (E3) component
MNIWGKQFSIGYWQQLIIEHLAKQPDEPIMNLNHAAGYEFDAIFLGGGASGRFGAAYLRALGGRVLIIDRWPFLGGSCPHQACVPHHVFSDCAAQLMLERTFSGQLWFQNLNDKQVSILDIINMFRQGRVGPHAVMNYQSKELLDIEFILNSALNIIDVHHVQIGDYHLHTKNLVIATGSRPNILDLPNSSLKGVFNYRSLVEELDYEPGKTVVVIGGGKTAIEYGCFFNATGRRTLVVAREIMPMLKDKETRDYALQMMQEQGMEFLSNSELLAIEGDDKVSQVRIKTPQGIITVETDFVFTGLGQIPNSEIAASCLNVALDDKGFIKIDSQMRTSVDNVYAVGDVAGAPMEMFKARKQGICAAKNIMGIKAEYHAKDYPDAMHSHYEISWLGLSEEQAKQQYANVKIMKQPPDNPDGWNVGLPAGDRMMLYVMMKPRMSGFQKLVIDGDSRKILGAFHIGCGAKESFSYLAYLVKRGITLDELAELDELFISPSYFIQMCRLRAGSADFKNL